MQHNNQSADARYRHEMRASAIMTLRALDSRDAAKICATFLDEISAGSPRLDPWGDLRADADLPELEVYFSSALKRLGNQALGIRTRKRLFAALWTAFTDVERRAFVAWAKETNHECA